jgi:hypothetical protein
VGTPTAPLSELAENMMPRIRRTCGSESAKRIIERADSIRQFGRGASILGCITSADINRALRELKLDRKYADGQTATVEAQAAQTPVRASTFVQVPRKRARKKGR